MNDTCVEFTRPTRNNLWKSNKNWWYNQNGPRKQNVVHIWKLHECHSHVLFLIMYATLLTNSVTITTPHVLHRQGWGQFRNWNWNWCQFQFQFQELELQRNWIKGFGIDKEELKELIQFLFLIVNSFWFFAIFLAESLNQFDLKPFWIQLTRISLDRYIILYDNLSIKWILHGSYWLHL